MQILTAKPSNTHAPTKPLFFAKFFRSGSTANSLLKCCGNKNTNFVWQLLWGTKNTNLFGNFGGDEEISQKNYTFVAVDF